MKIWQLKSNQCRYVTTDAPPHDCCGAPAADNEPYCPAHKKLCHRGTGKDWRALAEVIRLTERTVKTAPNGVYGASDVTPGVDEVLNGNRNEMPVATLGGVHANRSSATRSAGKKYRGT